MRSQGRRDIGERQRKRWGRMEVMGSRWAEAFGDGLEWGV